LRAEHSWVLLIFNSRFEMKNGQHGSGPRESDLKKTLLEFAHAVC